MLGINFFLKFRFRAENCGTQLFTEAHTLPNITLTTCNDRVNLIISPKIKQLFSVRGWAYCPSLKEFALRMVHVWKIPFSKNHIPRHLYEQLLSGPAALCMQCSRPMFTYTYLCLFYHRYTYI